jgi:hypothetical protein
MIKRDGAMQNCVVSVINVAKAELREELAGINGR